MASKCMKCGSTRTSRVFKWVKNLLWLTEIEITSSPDGFSVRKVRRKLFPNGNEWQWREYGETSKVRIPFDQLSTLRDHCNFWLKDKGTK
jgi:hypothetical protein